MAEINLLRALPKSKRDLKRRAVAKTPETIAESRKFGRLYFDGPREYGYGGYRYDGRWRPVARDIVRHFGLKAGERVLEIGCAKGFLVKDLMEAAPGLDVFGLDVSDYAVRDCPPETVGRLHVGTALDLPFPDGGFDCVLAINVLHNFSRPDALTALREIRRVVNDPTRCFVQVDAYRTDEERAIFEDWVLTALYYDRPEGWIETFREANYQGDWFWTILKSSGEMEAGPVLPD